MYIQKLKEHLNWSLIRAQLCTLAISVSFNGSWRVPRDAFRYGGLVYLLVFTAACLLVALPATLMQLAVGQLSQQDAVGIWRAVPFFRGVGYVRLASSFLAAIYSAVYVALSAVMFLYTIRNDIPFYECIEYDDTLDGYLNVFNASECLNETFLAPITEKPEYYIAVSLIIIVIWISLPFVLYSPVKSMRIFFYILGPAVVVLSVVLAANIGTTGIWSFNDGSDWLALAEPHVYYAALTQALMSTQLTGGYLVAAADTVYSGRNVIWVAVTLVCSNVIAGWLGAIFWFSISDAPGADSSVVAVLVQVYSSAADRGLRQAWPALTLAVLVLSGLVTLITLVFPIYDHLRRAVSGNWRLACLGASVAGVGGSMLTLGGRLPVLGLMDDVVVPVMASMALAVEVFAFIFIYGWKTLVADIEFIISDRISKWWVIFWCLCPGILVSVMSWCIIDAVRDMETDQPPWMLIVMAVTVAAVVVTVAVFAALAVARQVQYNIFWKVKSSFKPSRHWGPRDPITHYYWLTRREEVARGSLPPTAYAAWRLGHSATGSIIDIRHSEHTSLDTDLKDKPRSYSDDWYWTTHRKDYIKSLHEDLAGMEKKRSKSLDYSQIFSLRCKVRTIALSALDIHVPGGPPAEPGSIDHNECKYCDGMGTWAGGLGLILTFDETLNESNDLASIDYKLLN